MEDVVFPDKVFGKVGKCIEIIYVDIIRKPFLGWALRKVVVETVQLGGRCQRSSHLKQPDPGIRTLSSVLNTLSMAWNHQTGGTQTLCQCQYRRSSIPNSMLEYLGADCTPFDLSKRNVVDSAYMPWSGPSF